MQDVTETPHPACRFHRFLDIILYFAKQNLSFSGSSDKVGPGNYGNFLTLVALMFKKDSVLSDHLFMSVTGTGYETYLSHSIENEPVIATAKFLT